MVKLTPTTALNGFAQDWPELTLKEHSAGEIISLAIAHGHDAAFAKAFKSAFGTALPMASEAVSFEGGQIIWSAVDQYLLFLDGTNDYADTEVAAKFKGAAYAALQSDAWASLELVGARVHDVLERFIALDLRAAPHHFAARTSAHHMAVIVIKHNDNAFTLMSPSSSAAGFLGALVHTIENVIKAGVETA